MFYRITKVSFLVIIASGLFYCTNELKLDSTFKAEIVETVNLENVRKDVNFLFIIDNSGSMVDEIKGFINNLKILVESITPKNTFPHSYSFAVMETAVTKPIFQSATLSELRSIDCGDHKLSNFVSKSDAAGYFLSFSSNDFLNYEMSVFECAVQSFISSSIIGPQRVSPGSSLASGHGLRGRGQEHYFQPIENLLEQLSQKEGDIVAQQFFSKNSQLIIIFISDAPGDMFNTLKQRHGGNFAQVYAEDIFNQIRTFKRNDEFRAYGVVPVNENDCGGIFDYDELNTHPSVSHRSPRSFISNHFPSHVHHFVKLTQGESYPICLKNWGTHMTNLMQEIEDLFNLTFIKLKGIPDLNSIRVFVNGIELQRGVDWYYNPVNFSVKIFEDKLPPSVSQEHSIKVQYTPINPKKIL